MNVTLAHTPIAKKARVEIIPLIDVVFFLLATFVLFTLSLQKLASIELPLPQTGDIHGADTTVYVQVLDDGTYQWKQGRLATYEAALPAELRARMVSATAQGAKPRVMLIGVGKVSYGAMVHTLDELRLLGAGPISIETAPSR